MEQVAVKFSPEILSDLTSHYRAISQHIPLGPITSSEAYDRAVMTMESLLDAGAADEAHPLAGLVAIIGEAIAAYDDTHHHIPDASPREVLRFLMDQHCLRQSDFTEEIGSQGVVSEILAEKRDLNVGQIARLAERFGVSPAVFIAV